MPEPRMKLKSALLPLCLLATLPSGDQVYSSAPPNGLDGASPSIVSVSEVAVAAGLALPSGSAATKRRLRRPSAQVSQWRTNRPS